MEFDTWEIFTVLSYTALSHFLSHPEEYLMTLSTRVSARLVVGFGNLRPDSAEMLSKFLLIL